MPGVFVGSAVARPSSPLLPEQTLPCLNPHVCPMSKGFLRQVSS